MVYWGNRGRELWRKAGVLMWSGWFTSSRAVPRLGGNGWLGNFLLNVLYARLVVDDEWVDVED